MRSSLLSVSLSLALTSFALASGPVCPCATDLNNDGETGPADLALLLGDWNGQGLADFDASGLVDAADLAVLLGEWGPCDPPSNDACGNAIILDGETIVQSFCTASATTSEPPLPASCNGDRVTIGKDIWYRYTTPYSGKLIVHTCGSDFDTAIAVYGSILPSGCACPGGQISLASLRACDDDDSSCGTASFVEFDINANECLSIRVGGYKFSATDIAEGAGELTIRPIKTGDRCDIAHELPSNTHVEIVGTNAGDTWVEQDLSGCATGDTIDEWYRYVVPCQGTVTIDTCSPDTTYDTTLSVFSACGGVEIDCNDDSTEPGCQLGGFNRKSRVVFNGIGGEVIYIRVSGFQGATGTFRLTVDTDCVG